MKKNITLLSLILFCVSAYAQQSETELIRNAFKSEKKSIVAEFLTLTKDDAAKFWPVYEEYEKERSEFALRRIRLIESYVDHYEKMDDESTNKLVEESASIQKNEVVLREKYYGLLKKGISTSVAARFYQIEDVINVVVRMGLYEELPLLKK
ncbi:MAG TPA: hypothetical protein VIU12_08620 [Chryseolinea sp.]